MLDIHSKHEAESERARARMKKLLRGKGPGERVHELFILGKAAKLARKKAEEVNET